MPLGQQEPIIFRMCLSRLTLLRLVSTSENVLPCVGPFSGPHRSAGGDPIAQAGEQPAKLAQDADPFASEAPDGLRLLALAKMQRFWPSLPFMEDFVEGNL